MRTAGAVLVAAFAPAALGAGGEPRDIKALQPCPAIAVRPAPADWRQERQGEGFALRLPPSCKEETESPRRFVHGGTTWRCGTITVEVVWGMWGPSSFGEDRHACKGTLAGLPIVRASGPRGTEQRLIVWYRTGFVHEPMISAWSSQASDGEAIETIAYSGTLSVPRGPNP